MIEVSPHLIHVHILQVLTGLLFAARDEPAVPEAALANARRTRLLVLLESHAVHKGIALSAVYTNVVHKTRGEAVLTREERLAATCRTRLEVRDARGAEEVITSETLARPRAELSAHGALEFVLHVHIVDVLLDLKIERQNDQNYIRRIKC